MRCVLNMMKTSSSFQSKINKAYRRINDKAESGFKNYENIITSDGEDPTLVLKNSVGKRSLNDPNGSGNSPIWKGINNGEKFRDTERYKATNGEVIYDKKPEYNSSSPFKNNESVLFHGTPYKNTGDRILSSRGQIGTRNEFGAGFYTTNSPEMAKVYAGSQGETGTVLGLKRPSQIVNEFKNSPKSERNGVLKEYSSGNFEAPKKNIVVPKNEISGKLFNDVTQKVYNQNQNNINAPGVNRNTFFNEKAPIIKPAPLINKVVPLADKVVPSVNKPSAFSKITNIFKNNSPFATVGNAFERMLKKPNIGIKI